jgi:hypothetical protein
MLARITNGDGIVFHQAAEALDQVNLSALHFNQRSSIGV